MEFGLYVGSKNLWNFRPEITLTFPEFAVMLGTVMIPSVLWKVNLTNEGAGLEDREDTGTAGGHCPESGRDKGLHYEGVNTQKWAWNN